MKNYENPEIQSLFDLKPELLSSLSKVLQKSKDKPENLKSITNLSTDKETEILFEKVLQLITSGSIKLADLSKDIQRKLSQKNLNENRHINEEEVNLTEKYDQLLSNLEDKSKVEVTQTLSSLLQKSVSIKKLYDFKSDKKYKLLCEHKVDLTFLNDDLNRMTLFSKLLQKKVEDLKQKTLPLPNNNKTIQTLSYELIKNIKENRKSYPYLSLGNIEFTHFCFLMNETLFYFISYVPSTNTFNVYINKEFSDNTEISFGNLKRLYKEEAFFKDFEFHKEVFCQETYCLKNCLNISSFEAKIDKEIKENFKGYTFNRIYKKEDYFKNKVIFTKQTNLLKENENNNLLLLELKALGNYPLNVFTYLISSSETELENLKSLELI